MTAVLQNIRELLNNAGIIYREVSHPPTYTSEESARARGEDIKIGGKALLVKVDTEFKLFVLSAARRFDSKAVKQRFGAKGIRFATAEELKALTGLVPGCVPPFGRPILDFHLYVDESVFENEKIAFNAGSLTDSIVMSTADYRALAQGEVFTFSKP